MQVSLVVLGSRMPRCILTYVYTTGMHLGRRSSAGSVEARLGFEVWVSLELSRPALRVHASAANRLTSMISSRASIRPSADRPHCVGSRA